MMLMGYKVPIAHNSSNPELYYTVWFQSLTTVADLGLAKQVNLIGYLYHQRGRY